jgi:hypothetical protein
MVRGAATATAMSLSEPRYRHDSKLLDEDAIGQDDARRLRVRQDWKFVERLRQAIRDGHETPAGVLGVRNKRPS